MTNAATHHCSKRTTAALLAVLSIALLSCGSDDSAATDATAPDTSAAETSAATDSTAVSAEPATTDATTDSTTASTAPSSVPEATTVATDAIATTEVTISVAPVELSPTPTGEGTAVGILRAGDGPDGTGCFYVEFAGGEGVGIETGAPMTSYSGAGSGAVSMDGAAYVETGTAVIVDVFKVLPNPNGDLGEMGCRDVSDRLLVIRDLRPA